MSKFQLFSKISPLPLFGWVDYTCGGKRARDTVFISTAVLFRLINAEFHKKIGSFGAGGSSWCVSERKAAGRIFIGVKSLIFPSGCQSNPATADSETPAALQPLSYSYSTPPSFTVRDLFPYHNREQANNLCFFVMDIGQHQLCTLHICAVQLFEIFFDKSTWQAQHLSAVSLSWDPITRLLTRFVYVFGVNIHFQGFPWCKIDPHLS